LSMDFNGTCMGSSGEVTAAKVSTELPDSCGSSEALTEGPYAVHLHKNSLHPNNQFVAEQLQHQQKMVKLLMKQLHKEQGRCHSLEDALLESFSSVCPCCKCQLTCDSGPGH